MLPKLRTLDEVVEAFEGRISKSTLRREIQDGNLRVIRARASCNAPVLISEEELKRWIDELAGKRQLVPAPLAVAKNK